MHSESAFGFRQACALALLFGAPAFLAPSARAQNSLPQPEPPAPRGILLDYDGGGLVQYVNALNNVDPAAPQQQYVKPLLGDFLLTSVHDPVDDPMGATFGPVPEPLRAQLALPSDQGLLVAALANDGPAARAGLLQNDILLTLSDQPLTKAADLTDRLEAAGKTPLSLKLLRAGKPVTLDVKPVYRVTLASATDKEGAVDYYIGVGVESIDDALRSHLGLPESKGLLANQIVPGSPAEKVGVKTHDILLDLGDKPLDSTETLIAQVQAAKGKATVLKLLRAGKPLSITITPEPRKQEPDPHHNLDRLYGVHYRLNRTRPDVLLQNQVHNPDLSQMGAWQQYHPEGALRDWIATSQSGAHDPVAARLQTLDTELKALRKAVEEIRDTLKKDK
jgi:hypothetical protein